jgi:hypothetical protein
LKTVNKKEKKRDHQKGAPNVIFSGITLSAQTKHARTKQQTQSRRGQGEEIGRHDQGRQAKQGIVMDQRPIIPSRRKESVVRADEGGDRARQQHLVGQLADDARIEDVHQISNETVGRPVPDPIGIGKHVPPVEATSFPVRQPRHVLLRQLLEDVARTRQGSITRSSL